MTFGVQPAGPKGPDARSWLYYSVTPGAVLTDWVAIQNYSTRPIQVDVYAADASTNSSGQFTLAEQNATMADAGGWISLDLKSSKVTVPPRNAKGPSHVLVQLHLKVPMNAAPGDHGAGIIASLEAVGHNAQGDVIHFNQRVATRVYVRVSGALRPALTVTALTARYSGTWNPFGTGTVRVHYVVKNTGNVKLGGRQAITIQGWWPTALVFKGLADIPLLLPGGSVTVDTNVPGVYPEFRESVTVRITALQLPSDLNPPIPVESATTHTWAIPWPLLLLVAVLLLILWLVWRRSRRRADGRRARALGTAGDQPGPEGARSVDASVAS